jgi:hypothetical protein
MQIAENAIANGMSMEGNEFQESIQEIIKERKPRKIIETGTYLGEGSTRVIADALELNQIDYEMLSIEANPAYYLRACKNVTMFEDVRVLNGLSIPRDLLPTENQTEALIGDLSSENIFVDHQEKERIRLYMQECDFDVPDRMLDICMRYFKNKPNLIMLDSAGHIGFIEFKYMLSMLKGSCLIVLDDINHIKHYMSFNYMKSDSRFTIIKESSEKFGFCIAEYKHV